MNGQALLTSKNINLHFMSIISVQQLWLDSLRELFRRIVGSLASSTTIPITIDGISWFETEQWCNIKTTYYKSESEHSYVAFIPQRNAACYTKRHNTQTPMQQQKLLNSARKTNSQKSERLSWMSASTQGALSRHQDDWWAELRLRSEKWYQSE